MRTSGESGTPTSRLIEQLYRQAEIDTAALNKYKALADDAYDVLACGTTVEREAWMARWREAREQ